MIIRMDFKYQVSALIKSNQSYVTQMINLMQQAMNEKIVGDYKRLHCNKDETGRG